MRLTSSTRVTLDASQTSDPDGDESQFAWIVYPEPSNYTGALPTIENEGQVAASFVAPNLDEAANLHVILAVTDAGQPPLTRYARLVVTCVSVSKVSTRSHQGAAFR
ncbi:MAG: hypothetical protein WD872_11290 [Pirellulaceae bacterium]